VSDENVTVNVDGLDKLLKALKGKLPVARVGILGDSAARGSGTAEGAPTNAQVGAWAEFGTAKSPVRSFLRMPIMTFLQKRMESSGLFSKEELNKVVAQGTLLPWVKLVAILAEGIVAEAFDTGGFGTWVPSNMRRKKNHQTLIETQQLRNSVTSEVKEG
jgi:hypothetical protein